MVAEAETREETVIRIVRKTLRSEVKMTPLLGRVPKKRCTVVVPREVAATREAAVATRVAVAAALETEVTVRKAVVVTVTVVLPETVVVTDHTQEEDSVAVVDPRYPLLLKAEKASFFQTILGSKLRIKAT